MSVKKKINIALNRVLNDQKYGNYKCQWYGNDYGGFYVYDRYLSKDSIIYSFGIGEDISFDSELITKFNCKVYAYDPTPKSIVFVNEKVKLDNFIFHPIGLYPSTGLVNMTLPSNDKHVSGSMVNRWNDSKNHDVIRVEVKSLHDIIHENSHTEIDVLKMDIEGVEYLIVESIVKSKIIFKQLLIEFHHRFDNFSIKDTNRAIKRLNNLGFKVVAISRNCTEFTFLNLKYM